MPEETSSLVWKTNGPFQTAADGQRLHIRETLDAAIGGTLIGLGIMAAAAYGGYRLVQAGTVGWRVVGGVLLLLAAILLLVALRDLLGALGLRSSTRTPLLTLERGPTPDAGSLSVAGRRVEASAIRCFTTRPIESGRRGDLLRRMPVAVLHDGGEILLNLSTTPDWADFYARQAAAWMGLPYEQARR